MTLTVRLVNGNLVARALIKLGPFARRQLSGAVAKSALAIQNGARIRVRVRTGLLKSSVHSKILPGGLSAEIGTRVFYAPFLEHGTKPHGTVYPVNAKALSFIWHGRRVFFAHVEHKGSKPYPFLGPAFEEEKPRFYAAVPPAMRRALDHCKKEMGHARG
jgi:hypothetical protein